MEKEGTGKDKRYEKKEQRANEVRARGSRDGRGEGKQKRVQRGEERRLMKAWRRRRI